MQTPLSGVTSTGVVANDGGEPPLCLNTGIFADRTYRSVTAFASTAVSDQFWLSLTAGEVIVVCRTCTVAVVCLITGLSDVV